MASFSTVHQGHNLLGQRHLFVNATGRRDLVTSSIGDNGSDFFINAGIRTLDRLVNHPHSLSRHNVKLETGQYIAFVPEAKSITRAWHFNHSDPGMTRLEKKDIDQLRDDYPVIVQSVDSSLYPSTRYVTDDPQGNPLYYGILPIALSTDQRVDSNWDDRNRWGTRRDLEGAMFGSHYRYTGVLVLPAPDEDSTLAVWGNFREKRLSADEDENYWTAQYPELVVQAACYQLELFYRNTEGARDWMNALLEAVRGIDIQMAETEWAEADQMRG